MGMRGLLALALPLAVSGHVSMRYTEGQVGPIRNAGSATGNGRASVAGACGGNAAFGANGVGTAKDGDTVTLDINYAAGHNGGFRMAFSCGDTTQNGLSADDKTLTTAPGAGSCTGTSDGAPATYNDATGVPAQGQNSVKLTCTLPLQNNAAPQECTIATLDQRDWGGCVDINLLAAAAIEPPSSPPAPLVDNAGAYAMLQIGMVDTSAADFTCCALASGSLTVPAYQLGAGAFTASINAAATGCRTSVLTTAPTTAEHTVNEQVPFQLVSGSKYVGISPAGGQMAGQSFEFTIDGGQLDWVAKLTGDDQPIMCDGTSSLGLQAISLGNTKGSSSIPAGGAAVIIIIILVLIVTAGWFYLHKGNKPPGTSTYAGSVPPPPAGGGGGLPAGWAELKDPNSGASYFYNQSTGVTTWTRPDGRV